MLRAAMPLLFHAFVVSFALALGVAASGCDQDAGEPCQSDRDCESGLECNRALGSERGECIRPEDQPAAGSPGPVTPPAEDDAGASDADGG